MLIDKTKLTGKVEWEQSINLFYEIRKTISQYNQNYSHKAAWKKLRTNFKTKFLRYISLPTTKTKIN
jgi:dTDP-D-glucose 4,6-dehydratase